MNEKKKVGIVVAIIAILVVLIAILAITGSKKGEELYNKFEAAFNGSENTLVYIGRPTCGYCNLLSPSLQEMANRYDFDYIYINTDDFATQYMTQVMNQLELTKIATPYLAIVSNGKVVKTQNGYADYDVTFKFLQDNKIIAEDAELMLNYIDFSAYKELLAKNEDSVIVIGQSTCQYCVQAKLILNQLAEEKDVTINYLNISYLTEEEGEEFEKSLDYFQKEWGTPIMIIVNDGKMVDIVEQMVTKEEYIEFLEENGVL